MSHQAAVGRYRRWPGQTVQPWGHPSPKSAIGGGVGGGPRERRLPQLLLLMSLRPPLALLETLFLLLRLLPQLQRVRCGVGAPIFRSHYVSLPVLGIARLTPRRERGV
jgi:hypothetical protein